MIEDNKKVIRDFISYCYENNIVFKYESIEKKKRVTKERY